MRTMLDFYREHGVSPVTQVIPDMDAHFRRRAHLYRSLGLWPQSITGQTVLEVGPGSGQNALYTASLKPHTYALLEPNSVAASNLAALHIPRAVVIADRIEHYFPGERRFDVVLCEGLLGLCGSDPLVLLGHLIRHVKVGGVLVITCIDAISDHAEVLRRAIAYTALAEQGLLGASLAQKVAHLRPIFTPHLATLTGMTRSVDDWIIDNLLNPASIGPTFSIPDALTALDGQFELMGCNPRFLTDWRWYKDATPGNRWAIDAYWEQAHNLIDYRVIEAPDSELSHTVMAMCLDTRAQVAALERGEQVSVNTYSVDIDPGWFGRGQQYLSLVRVHA